VFQLDFQIFRTIASFIKISSVHSLIIKPPVIFIKFFWTIWEIGGQMSRDPCLAESLDNDTSQKNLYHFHANHIC
jgi:hypothetical protein